MEQQGSEARAEQCYSYGQSSCRSLSAGIHEIAVDQNRNQNRSSEHGEHVLQTQNQHLGYTQFSGITNYSI